MSEKFKRDFDYVLTLYKAGQILDAEDAGRRLVTTYPEAAPAHNILGIIQASNNNAAAAASFGRAIKLNPKFHEAYFNLGLTYCAQNNFSAAVEKFRASLKLRPANSDAHLNLGNALREMGQLDEACASYHRALEVGGAGNAFIHNNLGATFIDMGKVEDAVACFRRALEIKPNYAGAHLNLGRALQRLGDIDAAIANLGQAVDCAPETTSEFADAAIIFANALRDAGRFETAVDAYRRALVVRPNDHQALYHLGLVLMDLGRHAEGLRVISQGPGIARISLRSSAESHSALMPKKGADFAGVQVPTFIGCRLLDDPGVCEKIIEFFERHDTLHSVGRTGQGIDQLAKSSTDLTVLPKDLDKPGYEPIADYIRQLESCYQAYAHQWPYLGRILEQIDIVPFTIQRYREGGHFQQVHAERTSFGFMHRVLAWMTYLNDVDGGGETHFPHYNLNIRPERGKTLIWPAEWTHVHSGGIVTSGTKYIITGWMHFPHDSSPRR